MLQPHHTAEGLQSLPGSLACLTPASSDLCSRWHSLGTSLSPGSSPAGLALPQPHTSVSVTYLEGITLYKVAPCPPTFT